MTAQVGDLEGSERVLRGLLHSYLVPMWEENFLLQASLMGVTFLLFWVRGICPDRGWDRFHTLHGVKDTPAGPYVGDRGAAGLLGWIRTAEQRCASRLGGTGGRPGAHPAAPLMFVALRLSARTADRAVGPTRGRGYGCSVAFPGASPSPFPLPPPPRPRAVSSSLGLRSGTGPAERVPLSGRPAGGRSCGSGGHAASPRPPPCPPATAGLGPPSASPAPWLLLVLPRVIFIASIFCAGINK